MSQDLQIPPFVRRLYWKRNSGSAGGPGPGSMGWGCSVCVLHIIGEKTQWRRINCRAMGKERPAIKIIWDDGSLDQCSGVHLQLHSLLLNDCLILQRTGQQAQPCLYGSKDASRSSDTGGKVWIKPQFLRQPWAWTLSWGSPGSCE